MTNPDETNQTGDTFGGIFTDILQRVLDTTEQIVSTHGTTFLLGLFTFVIGWITAAVVRHIVTRLLRALGFDVLADRIGLRAYLERHDVVGRPSTAAGWILYIIILYTALVLAFDRMGLHAVADFLATVARFVPHLLVVVILLIVGVVLAKLARYVATGAARLLGLPVPAYLGEAARIAVLLLTLVVALDYLGWASTTILLGGLAVLVLGALGWGMLFAFSARRLAESLLARAFLSGTYRPGDRIRFGDVEGVIIKIDSTVTRLRSESGEIVITNRRLHESRVEILARATPAPAAPTGTKV